MGSSNSKVQPLLRANHKHDLLLKNGEPNEISIILAAACALGRQDDLFKIWDEYSELAVDAVSERTEEIVESEEIVDTDWRDHLGQGRGTAFVNFFDDELVRFNYDHKRLLKEYMKHSEIYQGMMAKNGLGIKLVSAGLQLDSSDCVTQGLAAAAAYYVPIELSDAAREVMIPMNEDGVVLKALQVVNKVIPTSSLIQYKLLHSSSVPSGNSLPIQAINVHT